MGIIGEVKLAPIPESNRSACWKKRLQTRQVWLMGSSTHLAGKPEGDPNTQVAKRKTTKTAGPQNGKVSENL